MHSDRRRLMTGLGAGLAVGFGRQVLAQPAADWVSYEQRLRARLADAGGGRFDEDLPLRLRLWTNRFRANEGVAGLEDDAELAACARAHAADMAARIYFGHDSPENFTPLDRAGLLARRFTGVFGENLAYRPQKGALTPESVLDGWRASPGHRENLVKTAYTHVGHGVVHGGGVWLAAAVYGGLTVRLGGALPFRADGAAVLAATARSEPLLSRYALAEPRGEPIRPTYRVSGPAPTPGPGAWRLLPLINPAPREFRVEWGPIFVV